jgi:hypothetical protein
MLLCGTFHLLSHLDIFGNLERVKGNHEMEAKFLVVKSFVSFGFNYLFPDLYKELLWWLIN